MKLTEIAPEATAKPGPRSREMEGGKCDSNFWKEPEKPPAGTWDLFTGPINSVV